MFLRLDQPQPHISKGYFKDQCQETVVLEILTQNTEKMCRLSSASYTVMFVNYINFKEHTYLKTSCMLPGNHLLWWYLALSILYAVIYYYQNARGRHETHYSVSFHGNCTLSLHMNWKTTFQFSPQENALTLTAQELNRVHWWLF